MKKRPYMWVAFLGVLLATACSHTEKKDQVITLKVSQNWKTDTIAPGYVWYNYTGYYEPTKSNQTINVLEIDYSNPHYNVEVVHSEEPDSLSSFATKQGAIAGINGSYFEPDVSFVKVKNHIYREVTTHPDSLNFWKHGAALFYDDINKELAIAAGDNSSYKASQYPTILSGAPLLIDNYKLVGETYADKDESIEMTSLHYEDHRRHQGVRHPRVAVALTSENRLLLVTVDGRWWSSAGMTAKELTQFLKLHFDPAYALNIDGGGSTTMWIRDRGVVGSNVVNYPTDNKRYDHFGQRAVNNVILIQATK